jgi:hypothetical protein
VAIDASLWPWHYSANPQEVERAYELRPGGGWDPDYTKAPKKLVDFAMRQDQEDYACFEVVDGRAERIFTAHWTNEGFLITAIYEDFWSWLKSVVEDIGEVIDLASEADFKLLMES